MAIALGSYRRLIGLLALFILASTLTIGALSTPTANAASSGPLTICGKTFVIPFGKVYSSLVVARQYCNTPYVFGSASKSGIDCSGLVMKAFAAYIRLPHSANLQYKNYTTKIGKGSLRPGDLVAFNYDASNDSAGREYDHIAIYLGKYAPDGRQYVLHAANTRVDVTVSQLPYVSGTVNGGHPRTGYGRLKI